MFERHGKESNKKSADNMKAHKKAVSGFGIG
jgi:hypothetical protein